MYPGSKPLKIQARNSIRAAAPSAILVTLVYLLCTDVLNEVAYLLTPEFSLTDLIYGRGGDIWLSLFLTILLAMFLMVMEIGYWNWALDVSHGQETGYGTLLNGFGMLGRILLMKLLVFSRILGWAFLMAFGYAILIALFSFSATMITGLTAVLYLSITAMILRFELAPLLLCDHPQDGAAAAVLRSAQLMRGHVLDYVKLHLSLLPWYLLTAGIQLVVGLLMLTPSMDAISSAYISGGFEALLSQTDLLLSAAAPTTLGILLTIPVNLFFLPLRHVAVANFYHALSAQPTQNTSTDSTF